MIGRLAGTVIEKHDRIVLLDVAGVGYEVMCPKTTFEEVEGGNEAVLVIATDMRDSSISLYGFNTTVEKQLFIFLNEVKGVGPRMAIEILSTMSATQLLQVIGVGDVKKVQSAKGVGKKTAERIILELKDKVSQYAIAVRGLSDQVETITVSDELDDSVLALLSLGFTKSNAERAVGQVRSANPELRDPGDIVKEALGYL